MKKLLLLVSIITFFNFTATSCSNDDSPLSYQDTSSESLSESNSIRKRTSQKDLEQKLANDADFIEYGDVLTGFFEMMPNRKKFLENYDEARFIAEKESYFIELSGYTNQEVIETLAKLDYLMANIYQKYPELKYDGTNEAYINTVIENACNIIDAKRGAASRDLAACRACVKKWKPRMIQATILGGVVGSLGGPLAAWGGAVIGFVGAGWGAVDCLEAAGC